MSISLGALDPLQCHQTPLPLQSHLLPHLKDSHPTPGLTLEMFSAGVLGEMNLQWHLQCARAMVLTWQHLMAEVEGGILAEEEAGPMAEEEAGRMAEEEEEVVVLVLDVVEEEQVEETEINLNLQRPC